MYTHPGDHDALRLTIPESGHDLVNCVDSELGAPAAFTPIGGAMFYFVCLILSRRSPTEICDSIIGWVAIAVRDLMIGWLWSYKRKHHQPMNQMCAPRAGVVAKVDDLVVTRVRRCLEDAFTDTIGPSILANHNAGLAPDSPSIADFIGLLVADDEQPSFWRGILLWHRAILAVWVG